MARMLLGEKIRLMGEFCTAGPWCVPFITAWISSLDQTQDVAMEHNKTWTQKLLFNFSHRGIERGLFGLEKRRFLGEGKWDRSRSFPEADWTQHWATCSRWPCSVQGGWVRWCGDIPSKLCCSVILGTLWAQFSCPDRGPAAFEINKVSVSCLVCICFSR